MVESTLALPIELTVREILDFQVFDRRFSQNFGQHKNRSSLRLSRVAWLLASLGLHQRIFTGIASCAAMKLLSVNVGLPRKVEWKGKIVRTSIFKAPVPGRVRVSKLNLKGDQQSDLSVHGGIDKAVYAYPSEHYPFWRQQLPDMDLPWGVFGENADVVNLYRRDATNQELLRRVSELPSLPKSWRDYFRTRLWSPDD